MKKLIGYCFILFAAVVLFFTDISSNEVNESTKALERRIAVVTVPYADATGVSQVNCPEKRMVSIFETFPFSPDHGTFSYFRICQLKYNEIIEIIREFGAFIEVSLSNFYFVDKKGEASSNALLLKKYVLDLSALSPQERAKLPRQIDRLSSPALYNQDVLTLLWPWKDRKSGHIYSVGTRFKRCSLKDTKKTYAFYLLDPLPQPTFRIAHIHKKDALVSYPKSFKKAIDLFLNIIKRWIRDSEGIIPYVFGGSSYTEPIADKGARIKRGFQCGLRIRYWDRYNAQQPHSGFDCSNLILIAAQICGIPYYFKNTATIEGSLTPLPQNSMLKNGDLIWYKGHIFIISDVKRNLLIEAAGYDSGYGKLHEIALSTIFPKFKNFADLSALLNQPCEVYRLSKNKQPYKKITLFKAFRLSEL